MSKHIIDLIADTSDSNTGTELSVIYHMSDIHIRDETRHDEYEQVFQNVYQYLIGEKENNPTLSACIVITGDIMHNQSPSPEAYSLTFKFLSSICEIWPAFVIMGNHDSHRNGIKRLDSLSPIFEICRLSNLFYLKNSGFYRYHNIIFGVTNVLDTNILSANLVPTNIWDNITQKHKYKIGLYHGTIFKNENDVGYRMNKKSNKNIFQIEHFSGYDYVLLGDIHRYHFLNKEQTIAYAGSLIQQNHGEGIKNHGILRWDLLQNKKKYIEIDNQYGFCTLHIRDGKLINNFIPKNPYIRFFLERTSQVDYQNILNDLKKEYNIMSISLKSDFHSKINGGQITKKLVTEKKPMDYNHSNIIKNFLGKNGLDEKEIDNLIILHEDIQKQVFPDTEEKKNKIGQSWRILELRFSNTLSYGPDNVINFREYGYNSIIGIMAPNHYGKSAILDIILFCLFDKFSRGERRDILNKNENEMKCSLMFSIGNQEYLIERIGKRVSSKLSVKIDVNLYQIKKNKDGSITQENISGLTKNATNKKITELIGNFEDYLVTSFCLQHTGGYDFTDMTNLQKKEFLCDILKLNVFDACHKYAKDKTKELTGQYKLLEQKVEMINLDETKEKIKELREKLAHMKIEKDFKERTSNLLSAVTSFRYDDIFPQLPTELYKKYKIKNKNDFFQTIEKLEHFLSTSNQTNDQELIILQERVKEHQKQLNQIDQDKINLSKQMNEKQHKLHHLSTQLITIKDRISLEQIHSELDNMEDTNEVTLSQMEKELEECKHSLKLLKKELQTMPIVYNLEDLKPYQQEFDQIILLLGKGESLYRYDSCNYDKLHQEYDDCKIFLPYLKQITSIMQSSNIGQTSPDLFKLKEETAQLLSHVNSRMQYVEGKIKQQQSTLPEIYQHYYQYSFFEEMKIQMNIIDNVRDKFTHIEIDQVQTRINYLEDKITNINRKNKLQKLFQDISNNNNIQIQMSEINQKLSQINENIQQIFIQKKKLLDDMSNLRNNIYEKQKYIKQYDAQKEDLKNLKKSKQLFLLQDFLNEGTEDLHQILQQKVIKLDTEIKELNEKIKEIDVHLRMHSRDIQEYLALRNEFDEKSKEFNMYQTYVQAMGQNGLPYEILKTYLPSIENEINTILQSFADFTVEFIFYDDEMVEKNKMKNIKANMGTISLNIKYADTNPYNVQLASGFEKFIINLAVRMTFSRISLVAKPNFLIVDEGWSCLDRDNLDNIGEVMSYLKTQYEYVIIISHLDELKSQANHIIGIARESGYSYIKTETPSEILDRKKTN